jgi:transcriptional regulator with XRE-family HTH domain
MPIDRPALAEFLRQRRESLQPDDMGLPSGQRRRTTGLRREEVALLSHMSTDYYSRIEQQRGPQPSEQMIAAIAQGLHLSLAERDHLYRLAGHTPPPPGSGSEHISPGMLRIFDRLHDTPAEIVSELGETLRQNSLGAALVGDLASLSGPARSIGYRWFTDEDTRARYAPDDHDYLGRLFASGLRSTVALRGPRSRAAHYVDTLLAESSS